jgi:DNA-binding NtrC family response regulator
MEQGDGTLSLVDESHAPARGEPQLFLALECERPLAASLRFALREIDEVLIGRGRGRGRGHRHVGRRLEIQLADPWMSTEHARIVRVADRWVLEDAGSTNGTLVNGATCMRADLADGDLLEVGRVFFLFRDAVPAARERQDPLVPELATFVASLAEQLDGLARVATRADVAVSITGESGTGKERVARAVHALSRRRGELVAVNCGAPPATLLEAALFGHRKGACSGADEEGAGLVRAASGGTLFLDEIGDLSQGSQVALLRLLQEGEVLPPGATRPLKVDLRVVSATHRDLARLVEQGTFRGDLRARLSGYQVRLPRLRDRREDLGLLVAAIIRRSAPWPEKVRLSGRAARALFRHAWPMNVRELDKALTTAIALAGDAAVELLHLPEEVRAAASPAESDAERRARLVAALEAHHGNVAQAAKELGKAPMQVHRWVKRYGLDLAQFRRPR